MLGGLVWLDYNLVLCSFFVQLFDRWEENAQQRADGQQPADGPNQIQGGQIALGQEWINHIHPEEPEGAHPYHGGNGGGQRLTHGSQRLTDDSVSATEEIGAGDDDHFFPGVGNDQRIAGHKAGQSMGEDGRQRAQSAAQSKSDEETPQHSLLSTFYITCADILTHIGHYGHGHSGTDLIENIIVLVGDAQTGGGLLAEGVHSRNDDHIGYGVEGLL